MNNLFEKVEKYQNNIFIRDDRNNTIKYKEAFDYSKELEKIINDRCLVLLFTKNTIGGVLNYFACLKNKVVPFLLSASSNKDFADNLINLYKPKYIFIPNELLHDYKEYEIVYQKYEYSILKTDFENIKLYDNLGILLSTSGSTGTEKFVRISYENLVDNVIQRYTFMDENFKYNNIDMDWEKIRCMLLMPFNYSYVLCMINTVIYTGASLLLSDKKAFEKEFWEFFIKERSTVLFGVPLHCQILDKIGFFNMPNDYLRYITIAGAALPDDLFNKCMKFSKENNIVFDIGYGQTEASAVISELETDKMIEKKGSIGKGQIKQKLYLIGDDGKKIDEPNVMGELVVEGSNVALGYANDRNDLEKGDEFKGKLFTGDIAIMDDDGYFYIKGRKKRFVKIYGKRVNLDNIENIIKTKFKEVEVVAIGKDNNIVVLINNKNLINEIESYILNKLEFNKKVLLVKYTDNELRNESGKVLYSQLAELHLL